MAKKQSTAVEKAIINPERAYCSPEEVLADSRLSKEEKLRILDSWALDEDEMCRAESENMTPKAPCNISPDELLQRISNAKLEIGKM